MAPTGPPPTVTAAVGSRPYAAQQPEWPDPAQVREVTGLLRDLPPLVSPAETARVLARLAEAATGNALLLQGGHCAEEFGARALREATANAVLLRQMATVLSYGTTLPVLPVGRMAGQYAKPRSRPTEAREGMELPSYRGDAVNAAGFSARERRPDPRRMVTAYYQSAEVLHRIRAGNAVRPDVPGATEAAVEGPVEDLYVSHEALLLDYERALVRTDPATGGRYASSGHLLWIGERTRQVDGAHVEFAAGVDNPVAVKVGPTTTPDELLALAAALDPGMRPGRLTFVTRMGADRIREVLPELVGKVAASGSPALWVCDPMHGNTRTTEDGAKTRWMSDVTDEVRAFIAVHRAIGTHPGGLHLELTADDVTECLGGSTPVRPEDLDRHYTSVCDPRLNHGQSLDLAFFAAHLWGTR
ncbi:3-deoxy-7-phosphoheptulonate synthase [Streptomyces sp. NPDC006992]|uniref:3-deoxy-7-phosphoheptulonate synthase n=1 Tax=Streptomyces sp. NPDC006992 TaxID=3155601 RepID=UPI0033DF7850